MNDEIGFLDTLHKVLGMNDYEQVGVIGRTNECNILQSKLSEFIINQRGALYIGGTPGTGKTYCLSKTLQDHKKNIKSIQLINAMQLADAKSTKHILQSLSPLLPLSDSQIQHLLVLLKKGFSKKNASLLRDTLFSFLPANKKNPSVLVLDECDQLVSSKMNLYLLATLISAASQPNSGLVLFLISNTLDFVERYLCPLGSLDSDALDTLIFPAYSFEDLRTIVDGYFDFVVSQFPKTGSLMKSRLFASSAVLELPLRKISSSQGDCRKALDAIKRLLVENAVRERNINKRNRQEREEIEEEEEEEELVELGEDSEEEEDEISSVKVSIEPYEERERRGRPRKIIERKERGQLDFIGSERVTKEQSFIGEEVYALPITSVTERRRSTRLLARNQSVVSECLSFLQKETKSVGNDTPTSICSHNYEINIIIPDERYDSEGEVEVLLPPPKKHRIVSSSSLVSSITPLAPIPEKRGRKVSPSSLSTTGDVSLSRSDVMSSHSLSSVKSAVLSAADVTHPISKHPNEKMSEDILGKGENKRSLASTSTASTVFPDSEENEDLPSPTPITLQQTIQKMQQENQSDLEKEKMLINTMTTNQHILLFCLSELFERRKRELSEIRKFDLYEEKITVQELKGEYDRFCIGNSISLTLDSFFSMLDNFVSLSLIRFSVRKTVKKKFLSVSPLSLSSLIQINFQPGSVKKHLADIAPMFS